MSIALIKDLSETIAFFLSGYTKKENENTHSFCITTFESNLETILEKLFYFVFSKGLYSPLKYTNESLDKLTFKLNKPDEQPVDGQSKFTGVKLERLVKRIKNKTTSLDSLSSTSKKAIAFSFIVRKKRSAVIFFGIQLADRVLLRSLTFKGISRVREDSSMFFNKQRQYYKKLYGDYLQYTEQEKRNILISEYCQIISMHPKTFKRKFKNYIGTTFYDYHIKQRLLKGLYLLFYTQYTVSQIAYISGYENYSAFIIAFNKDQKYIPSDYRLLR
ncbi:helix-turn-helix domain-containing protein [Myroides pelagicus]|uniref:Helix-turn-helix domain-containing protein n=1 Tax=Myroides pelagicus TaxID=270914 RepID=A0A7K1GPV7_9FLAO|nr:AraC family transcriptional regulator [Myroides pelagicus]MTH30886.1 helix-turn-helix domain-containing protein [Myroides pelagicus]